MSYLGNQPSVGITPIGGLVPVHGGYDVTGTDFLKADGSDITASSYPNISGTLPAATSSTARMLPSTINFSAIGYGNGTWIALPYSPNGTAGMPYELSFSTDGVNWTNRAVYFPGIHQPFQYMSQIKYLNGAWYAIGSASYAGINPPSTGVGQEYPGYIYRSTDGGLSWITVFTGQYAGYLGSGPYDFVRGYSLKYINGVYFAIFACVSSHASNEYTRYFTSTDGINWTARYHTATTAAMNGDIAYGAGLYVMPSSGYTLSSPDYITWTSRTNTQSVGWCSVAYGAGCFVTVQGMANGTASTAGYSTDGITWSAKTIPTGRYTRVIYANSMFVAIGDSVCATSTDGQTWTARTVPTFKWWDIDYSATHGFIAITNTLGSTKPSIYMRSTDGITWTSYPINQSLKCSNVIYNTNDGFVTFDLTSGYVMTSSDGLTWTRTSSAANVYQCAIASNPAGTMYVGSNSVGTIHYSTNLTTWTSMGYTGPGASPVVKWLNDKFVVLGRPDSGYLIYGYYSYDGTTWFQATFDTATVSTNLTPMNPMSAAYGNGMYVALAAAGVTLSNNTTVAITQSRTALSSTDGINWKITSQLPSTGVWTGVEYGNGVFVAISTRVQLTNSGINAFFNGSNAVTPSGWSETAGDSTAVSGRICAVSTNGVDWVMSYMPVVGEWTSITFNGHVFIAVDGQSKSYATSKDGFNWNLRAAPDVSNWVSIISNTSTNVSVAVSGDNYAGSYWWSNTQLKKYGLAMRITESATSVTLPYVRPQEGLNYIVRVK